MRLGLLMVVWGGCFFIHRTVLKKVIRLHYLWTSRRKCLGLSHSQSPNLKTYAGVFPHARGQEALNLAVSFWCSSCLYKIRNPWWIHSGTLSWYESSGVQMSTEVDSQYWRLCASINNRMQLLYIMVTGEHGDCGGHVIKLHRGPHTPVLIYVPVKWE